MNVHNDSHTGTVIYVSILLGTVFSAAILFLHWDNPIAGSIIDFGGWIASWAGLHGYCPALIISSFFGGIILMCVVCTVAPVLQDSVAKKGIKRSKGVLQQSEGISIEEERDALVKRFGQKPAV